MLSRIITLRYDVTEADQILIPTESTEILFGRSVYRRANLRNMYHGCSPLIPTLR